MLQKSYNTRVLIRKGTGKRNIQYLLNDAKNDAKEL